MKYTLAIVGLLLMFGLAGRASAQVVTITYDSIPIDSIFYAVNPIFIDSIIGPADHYQARMGGSDAFAVQFAAQNQGVYRAVTFDPDSAMDIYWSRESADSCAMDIQFQYYNFSGTPVLGPTQHIIESGPQNVSNVTEIRVPDSGYAGYNTLYISVGSNPNAGEPGADSCFLDAIVLHQTGTIMAGVTQSTASNVPLLQSYPNPFYHASGTRVQVNAPVSGNGELSMMDALGREVERVPIGELSAGSEQAALTPAMAGVYFVRLLIDGQPYGAPIEISAQ